MDIIYSSSYDRTGIKDYAIFKNLNLTQLNNKVAYIKNILIYRYMHKKKNIMFFLRTSRTRLNSETSQCKSYRETREQFLGEGKEESFTK